MNNEITELKFDILAKREENISKEANGLAKKKKSLTTAEPGNRSDLSWLRLGNAWGAARGRGLSKRTKQFHQALSIKTGGSCIQQVIYLQTLPPTKANGEGL